VAQMEKRELREAKRTSDLKNKSKSMEKGEIKAREIKARDYEKTKFKPRR